MRGGGGEGGLGYVQADVVADDIFDLVEFLVSCEGVVAVDTVF